MVFPKRHWPRGMLNRTEISEGASSVIADTTCTCCSCRSFAVYIAIFRTRSSAHARPFVGTRPGTTSSG
uniref:Uncharacterized protein n=1 Tax=Hyaloperonospora arabidopsidis (strain Emoy2) TaxID=559515 RepID=M4BCW4_HYAAE